MAAKMATLSVTMTGDFMAAVVTKFALKEIVRMHEEDPFGSNLDAAAGMASKALEAANALEGQRGP